MIDSTATSQRVPTIAPVEPENIPDLLKREARWLGWWPGPPKPDGKFDKFPVDPQTGQKINPLNPASWLSFSEALAAWRRDMAKGIGFVLSDQHPIIVNGTPVYLTAIDLDRCAAQMVEHNALWRELGDPYVEVSPSGNGLRMFGFCTTPLKGGNVGDGRELYSTKRFMTVTGQGGRGTLKDISAALIAVEQRWFPRSVVTGTGLPAQPVIAARPETTANVAAVLSMLDSVSSDTDYESWRSIIWALSSTGWTCALAIAHKWSARARHRYDADAVDRLFAAFDPSRGITLGTLIHHARQNGWSDSAMQLSGQIPPLPPLPPLPPPPPPPPPPPIPASQIGPLLTASELQRLPPVSYVVRGLLPAQGLVAIYGEPGSGKSFLALDLAHAVANGRATWFGFPVKRAPVAYVALEGQGGMAKRVAAVEKHTGESCDNTLRFWCRDFHLLSDESVQFLATQIVATIGSGAIVVIDTLNQASPGADENSSQDMGRLIASAKRVAAIVGGLVILVHHAGKNRSQGLRGHSSLLAAMDVVIEVLKLPGHRKWHVVKAKDDSSDISRDFELVTYEVAQDFYGPVKSCAVQQTAIVPVVTKARVTGKHQKAVMAKLQQLLPAVGQRMNYQSAVQQVATVLTAAAGKERDRAKEAVDALIRRGHLSLNDGGVALAD
ncbi:MAG: AAA family ATPase [Sphingomonas sp.]|uniref:AAA family ATPase n=1 Tax=Sphingomonas sp. TaxID=28214 RepID=UPI0025E2B521|nr:AAA family ATPase [Sphingomonas sp.]MBY0282517.1 AAA family ATPase [Sphingomonas sp.]